jgi:hypothetical protein
MILKCDIKSCLKKDNPFTECVLLVFLPPFKADNNLGKRVILMELW